MSIYEAFVYEWINHTNGMKYVGFHKGRPDDGYVCSSKYMIDEYRANPSGFQRKSADCLIFEKRKHKY